MDTEFKCDWSKCRQEIKVKSTMDPTQQHIARDRVFREEGWMHLGGVASGCFCKEHGENIAAMIQGLQTAEGGGLNLRAFQRSDSPERTISDAIKMSGDFTEQVAKCPTLGRDGLKSMEPERHTLLDSTIVRAALDLIGEVSDVAAVLEKMHDTPGLDVNTRMALMRASLILEEPAETAVAMLLGDVMGTFDGLCDSLYVLLGTAWMYDLDVGRGYDVVHASNMTKKRMDIAGRVRDKGEDWKPAEEGLAKLL